MQETRLQSQVYIMKTNSQVKGSIKRRNQSTNSRKPRPNGTKNWITPGIQQEQKHSKGTCTCSKATKKSVDSYRRETRLTRNRWNTSGWTGNHSAGKRTEKKTLKLNRVQLKCLFIMGSTLCELVSNKIQKWGKKETVSEKRRDVQFSVSLLCIRSSFIIFLCNVRRVLTTRAESKVTSVTLAPSNTLRLKLGT